MTATGSKNHLLNGWNSKIVKMHGSEKSIQSEFYFAGVHKLSENYELNDAEYNLSLNSINILQILFNNWIPYVENDLNKRQVHLPANVWKSISRLNGNFCIDRYSMDLMRLGAPFMGFHLPILDRFDIGAKFDNTWAKDMIASLANGISCFGNGIPANIQLIMDNNINYYERLEPYLDDYLRLIHNLPNRYHIKPLRRYGEIGLDINDSLINHDTLHTQWRINALYNANALSLLEQKIEERGCCRVLEIGPGYGALGAALLSIYKDNIQYIAIDLPSTMYYSLLYLQTFTSYGSLVLANQSEEIPSNFRILLLCNYLVDQFKTSLGKFDLAINTMSFNEMSGSQIAYYANLIRDLLTNQGMLYVEGKPCRPEHTDTDACLRNYFTFEKVVPHYPVYLGYAHHKIWANVSIGD